jgi:S-adenosylmethionine:tRNA ribosyltransferase-isomerase
MRLEDFDFPLPAELISQAPSPDRGASRLLALDRASGDVQHRMFADLPELLRPGDVLVMNDTRVIPARLVGRKEGTGGKAELLLVRPDGATSAADVLARPAGAESWVCLGQASKGLREGARLDLGDGFNAEVLQTRGGGEVLVRFRCAGGETLAEALNRAGQVPLPPYIERAPVAEDAARYQTVYARTPGSVAAPTAGLHFTQPMLDALEAQGVERVWVTLDVGPGTFVPVRETVLDHHIMHAERYSVPADAARQVTQARREGRRVVAVGTTAVRTLEAAWDAERRALREGTGETSLFVRPGYAFAAVDAMITNFHLPRSTLLMLVSAFAGRERVLEAYRQAVERRYGFFSYGDAMWIGG